MTLQIAVLEVYKVFSISQQVTLLQEQISQLEEAERDSEVSYL